MADVDPSKLHELLLRDPAERERFREDPAEWLQGHGYSLTPEQRENIGNAGLGATSDDDMVKSLQTDGISAWL